MGAVGGGDAACGATGGADSSPGHRSPCHA